MELVPRSVGELLTAGLALLRRTAGPLALVAMPFCVLELVLRDTLFGLLPLLVEGVTPETPIEDALRVLALVGAALSGLVVLLAFVTQSLSVAVSLRAAAAVFGQPLTPMETLRATAKRGLPIAGTTLLWFFAIILLGFVLPAALLAAVAYLTASSLVVVLGLPLWVVWFAAVMVVLGLRWAVWPQTLALEGLAGVRALRRSRQLMGPPGVVFYKNPKFRLSLLLLVYFVVQSAVQQLFLLPSLVRGFGQDPPFQDMSLWSMPLLWAVPLAFGQVATNALVLPLNGVLTTLFYFDLRVRYEGFDLDTQDEERSRASADGDVSS